MTRIFLIVFAVASTLQCGGGSCDHPNPEYDASDPASASCLDTPGINGALESEQSEESRREDRLGAFSTNAETSDVQEGPEEDEVARQSEVELPAEDVTEGWTEEGKDTDIETAFEEDVVIVGDVGNDERAPEDVVENDDGQQDEKEPAVLYQRDDQVEKPVDQRGKLPLQRELAEE